MVKNDFITKITEKVDGITKKDAGVILEAISEIITDALVAGDDITLPNVGKFSVSNVPERTGIVQLGDHKGEKWVKEAHKKPSFKAAKALKDTVK